MLLLFSYIFRSRTRNLSDPTRRQPYNSSHGMDEEDVPSEHHIADEEDAYWEDDELEQDEELYSDMQQNAPGHFETYQDPRIS